MSLPDDVLNAVVEDGNVDNSRRADSTGGGGTDSSAKAGVCDATDRIGDAVDLLRAAERPLILAGPAMARGPGWRAVLELAAAATAPALPMTSPRGVNDPHLHLAVNKLAEADLVVLVDKKLDFSLRFGDAPFVASCRSIHIGADVPPICHNDSILSLFGANPVDVAREMAAGVRGRALEEGDDAPARATTPPEWEPLFASAASPIHPLRICAAVQPFLSAGGIFVSDGGEFGQWAQAGCEAATRIINGPAGSIGSALPMALGAHGELVEDPAQLTPAIERALASGLPACINIAIEPAPAPSLLEKGGGPGQARGDRAH